MVDEQAPTYPLSEQDRAKSSFAQCLTTAQQVQHCCITIPF
ncbi:hypothetical protein GGD63_005805 [Bradyrhizobium sp. cir1]|nr:hypothetical protein [Bradyrhizobium sp. cir1]